MFFSATAWRGPDAVSSSEISIDDATRHETLRKAALAAFVGNFVEWFDYATYTYLSVVISEVFFPGEDRTLKLMGALGIFALSFLVRPIGAAVWGRLGDRYGRRWVLSVAILMMTGATVLIGLIPPYVMIGIWAPILLLVMRLIQGFSASGEYAGAATFLAEYAPTNKRGMYTSLVPASTASGLLVGSLSVALLTALLNDASMHSWGWRIPFLVAGPLGLLGRHILDQLEDSPVYREMAEKAQGGEGKEPVPFSYVFKHHGVELLIAFAVASLNAVAFYLLLTYMPTYLQEFLNFDKEQTHLAESVTLAVYILLIFGMGHLSDKFGRRHMLIIASVGFILFTVPLFMLLDGATLIAVIAIEVAFCIMLTANDGTLATFLAETFPTKIRYTGFALSFNLANAIFGGSAPFIATWLVKVTGSNMAPAWYLVGISVFALIGMIAAKERSHAPLRD